MSLFHHTSFQRDLLVIISGLERPTGQDIKDTFETAANIEVTHGRLYPNLDTLVEDDLIEKGPLSGRANYYTLTEQGERALRRRTEWRQNWIDATDSTIDDGPQKTPRYWKARRN